MLQYPLCLVVFSGDYARFYVSSPGCQRQGWLGMAGKTPTTQPLLIPEQVDPLAGVSRWIIRY